VFVAALLVGGIVGWLAARLALNRWWGRWRGDDGLAEVLRPYQSRSVADQAQEWLDSR
jgi:hypothetical protein